jgi:hypothetical protein
VNSGNTTVFVIYSPTAYKKRKVKSHLTKTKQLALPRTGVSLFQLSTKVEPHCTAVLILLHGIQQCAEKFFSALLLPDAVEARVLSSAES